MVAAVIRSFEPDQGIMRVLLVGTMSETALRVRGSDRRTIARQPQGKPISFELARDRYGRDCAVDVAAL
jgi:hypothetical protein